MLRNLIALCVVCLLPLIARADAIPMPQGDVLLTISGKIAQTNSDGVAEFDLAMLQEVGALEYRTHTIWTEGEQTFVGVPLVDLMNLVEADGTIIRATAMNDYSVTIPVDGLTDQYPIVAYVRNGSAMRVRHKGPLWVVYPYDTDPKFASEVFVAQSIWHLKALTVE